MKTRELREFLQTITSNLSEFGLISTIAIELIPQPKPFIGYIYGYCGGVKIDGLVANDNRYSTLLHVIIKELESLAGITNTNWRDTWDWSEIQLLRLISKFLTTANKDHNIIHVTISDLCVGRVLIISS